jgi:hypothetical protein
MLELTFGKVNNKFGTLRDKNISMCVILVHWEGCGPQDCLFYSNPTGCTIFSFLEKYFALHVSDVTCIHHQQHNCSVQP